MATSAFEITIVRKVDNILEALAAGAIGYEKAGTT
jgi:hypothetical protein